MSKIIICTPTYNRSFRYEYISRAASVFSKIENILWIVVEDNNVIDERVDTILKKSFDKNTQETLHTSYIYYAIGPTRKYGMVQWNSAMEYIYNNNIEGIVYCTGDDNYWEPELFKEIRKTQRISMFPVGNLGPNCIEGPIIDKNTGIFIRWDSNGMDRKFPVDFNSFAFNSSILKCLKKPFWNHTTRSGESTFLEKFINNPDEFEFLCNNCQECYVWHNEPLHNLNFSIRRKLKDNHDLDILKNKLTGKKIYIKGISIPLKIIDGLYYNRMYSFITDDNDILYLDRKGLNFRKYVDNVLFVRLATFNIYIDETNDSYFNLIPFISGDSMIIHDKNKFYKEEINSSQDFMKKSRLQFIEI